MNKKELSLIRYLKELLNRIWVVVILTVVGGALMFTYSNFFATPMYTSKALMIINNKESSTSSISNSDMVAREALVRTYAAIIKTKTITEKVCDKIDEFKFREGYEFLQDASYNPDTLANRIEVKAVNETPVFEISLSVADRFEAQFIIEAITEYLPEFAKNTVEASSVMLVEAADLPDADKPSSPHIMRNSIIGAAIGFVIAAIIIFLILMTDTVVRNENDLTEAFDDVIVLGTIPLMHIDTEKSSSADAKALH